MNKKSIFYTILVVFGTLLLGYFAGSYRVSRNFHEVDAGKFYRSAQLSSEELDIAIQKYGIKTVINLRGSSDHQEWYLKEKEIADKNGVALASIPMSSDYLPKQDQLVELLDLYKNSPRPILVHCRAGSDRTGEATALYAVEYMGKTKEQAKQYFNFFKYGHISATRPAKEVLLDIYQGYDWAKTQYNPCSEELKSYANGCK